MRTITLLLLPALSLALGVTACQPAGSEGTTDPCASQPYRAQADAQWLNTELLRYQAANQLPGAILAVKRAGQPLWIGATGQAVRHPRQAMQVCTPFRLGSITKVFVAVAALKLQEQGKLNLDAKLTTYLPALRQYLPQADLLTVRMLLNHSGGVVDPKNDDPAYTAFITKYPEAVDRMSVAQRLEKYVYGRPLQFRPGTASHYSNGGYWLVGEVLQQVTHQPMQSLLQTLIFQPLRLPNTYYEERLNPRVAHGYFVVKDSLQDVTRFDKADGDGDPSSGIVSTAADLYQFSQALFAGSFLTPASQQQLTATLHLAACPAGTCEYGLGIETWRVGQLAGYGKNGSSIGYEANWIYLPAKQLTFIAFTNKGGGSIKAFINEIAAK